MGQGFEQTFLQVRHTKDVQYHYSLGKCKLKLYELSLLTHLDDKTDTNKRWRGCGRIRTLIHCCTAVCCHPVCLTYMLSPSTEMPGWMSYKPESRQAGETSTSTTSDMWVTPR